MSVSVCVSVSECVCRTCWRCVYALCRTHRVTVIAHSGLQSHLVANVHFSFNGYVVPAIVTTVEFIDDKYAPGERTTITQSILRTGQLPSYLAIQPLQVKQVLCHLNSLKARVSTMPIIQRGITKITVRFMFLLFNTLITHRC